MAALAPKARKLVHPGTVILSALLALWTYLGTAITRAGSAFSYLHDIQHILLSVLVLLGGWVAYDALLTLAFWLLDAAVPARPKRAAHSKAGTGTGEAAGASISIRASLGVFLVILACWVPYLVVSFPGLINFDYFNQLNQFVGSRPLSNHHPVFMTFVLGALYEVGHLFGGASGGLFLTVLVQALCLDGLFCYLHRCLCRMGARRGVRIVVVAFCALCPIFPLYACILVKDTFSAITLGLFATQVALRAWYDRNDDSLDLPRMATLPAIAAVGVLCSLTRANCVYLVLGVLFVCLFWLRRTGKLRLVVAMAVVAVAYVGWTNVLLPAAGVTPSDAALVISIPLQQTGAFARDAASQATDDERAAIEDLLVVSYDEVGQLYTPNIVDPLQGAARDQADDRDTLRAYLSAWAAQGLRRPDIYVDALLRANVGYWYPGIPFDSLQDVDYLQNTPISHYEWMKGLGYEFGGDLADMDTAVSPFDAGRSLVERQLVRLSGMPVLGLVLQPALYSWFCLIVGLWAASRKRAAAPLFALAILLFLVECVSPLAASMRYALPLVVLTPILLGTSLARQR